MSTSRRDTNSTKARSALGRFAVLLVLLSSLYAPVGALAASVDIIVNPAQAAVPIDRRLLRAIFTMRLRQWPDGTPVRVFVLPDRDEVTALFCREQLGTYPLRDALHLGSHGLHWHGPCPDCNGFGTRDARARAFHAGSYRLWAQYR